MEPLQWRGQLSHIGLKCTDRARATRFYTDVVGLTVHKQGEHVARLGWGTGHHVLDLLEGETALDHYALEVARPEELKRLVARIQRSGVEVGMTPSSRGHPEAYVITDPDGRIVELHGRVDRGGEHVAGPGRRPIRLQHITLATPSVSALTDFYVDVLGLRVSDRMGEGFTWLRCGAEHHTIAMVEHQSETQLDHFSFDVSGWGDFLAWADRLSRLGVPLSWGPGRHGPGNNLFLMFDDPEGNHVELSAEMESYFDERARYTHRHWAEAVSSVNLWGIAPAWRRPGAVAGA